MTSPSPNSVFQTAWAQVVDPSNPTVLDARLCFDLIAAIEALLPPHPNPPASAIPILSKSARQILSSHLDQTEPGWTLSKNDFLALYKHLSGGQDLLQTVLPNRLATEQPTLNYTKPRRTPFKTRWNTNKSPQADFKRSVSLNALSMIDTTPASEFVPDLEPFGHQNDHIDNENDDDLQAAFTQNLSRFKSPPDRRRLRETRSHKDIKTIGSQQDHISYLEDQNATLTSQLADLRTAVARLERENRNLKESEDAKHRQLEQMEAHLATSTQELQDRRQQYTSLSEAYLEAKREARLKDNVNKNTNNDASSGILISSTTTFPHMEVPQNSTDLITDLKTSADSFQANYLAFLKKLNLGKPLIDLLTRAMTSHTKLFIAIIANLSTNLTQTQETLKEVKSQLQQKPQTLVDDKCFAEFKDLSARSLASNTDEHGNIDLDTFLDAIQRISDEQKAYLTTLSKNTEYQVDHTNFPSTQYSSKFAELENNDDSLPIFPTPPSHKPESRSQKNNMRPRSRSTPSSSAAAIRERTLKKHRLQQQLLQRKRLASAISAANSEKNYSITSLFSRSYLSLSILVFVLSFIYYWFWASKPTSTDIPQTQGLPSSSSSLSSILWWQRFGGPVESLGKALDKHVRPIDHETPV